MTKPMDPEIVAMRAMARALRPLDDDARERVVTWLFAFQNGTSQEEVRGAMERRRWLRSVG